MFRFIIQWLLSAVTLMAVAKIVPGFEVTGDLQSALIAALVIGFLNAMLGSLLKLLTFPFAILTCFVFLLGINAAMMMLSSTLASGVSVDGWHAAFLGSTVLAVLGLVFRFVMQD